jgi:hypothetical protein
MRQPRPYKLGWVLHDARRLDDENGFVISFEDEPKEIGHLTNPALARSFSVRCSYSVPRKQQIFLSFND